MPPLRQQRHHGAGQWRHDLVLADLLLIVAAEWIDPMQLEPAIARPQIQFVAFDDGENMRSDAVEREIEAAGRIGCEVKAISRSPIDSVAGPLP